MPPRYLQPREEKPKSTTGSQMKEAVLAGIQNALARQITTEMDPDRGFDLQSQQNALQSAEMSLRAGEMKMQLRERQMAELDREDHLRRRSEMMFSEIGSIDHRSTDAMDKYLMLETENADLLQDPRFNALLQSRRAATAQVRQNVDAFEKEFGPGTYPTAELEDGSVVYDPRALPARQKLLQAKANLRKGFEEGNISAETYQNLLNNEANYLEQVDGDENELASYFNARAAEDVGTRQQQIQETAAKDARVKKLEGVVNEQRAYISTLNESPNSTQREIRRAELNLRKTMREINSLMGTEATSEMLWEQANDLTKLLQDPEQFEGDPQGMQELSEELRSGIPTVSPTLAEIEVFNDSDRATKEDIPVLIKDHQGKEIIVASSLLSSDNMTVVTKKDKTDQGKLINALDSIATSKPNSLIFEASPDGSGQGSFFRVKDYIDSLKGIDVGGTEDGRPSDEEEPYWEGARPWWGEDAESKLKAHYEDVVESSNSDRDGSGQIRGGRKEKALKTGNKIFSDLFKEIYEDKGLNPKNKRAFDLLQTRFFTTASDKLGRDIEHISPKTLEVLGLREVPKDVLREYGDSKDPYDQENWFWRDRKYQTWKDE